MKTAIRRPKKGVAHPFAKLNPSDIDALREGVAFGVTRAQLARDYGVSPTAVSQALTGARWSPTEIDDLTDDDVARIRDIHREFRLVQTAAVARMFGLALPAVVRIREWAHPAPHGVTSRALLTREQVVEIRSQKLDGELIVTIARRYGVSSSVVKELRRQRVEAKGKLAAVRQVYADKCAIAAKHGLTPPEIPAELADEVRQPPPKGRVKETPPMP